MTIDTVLATNGNDIDLNDAHAHQYCILFGRTGSSITIIFDDTKCVLIFN